MRTCISSTKALSMSGLLSVTVTTGPSYSTLMYLVGAYGIGKSMYATRGMPTISPTVLFLCTGNATRSVLAGTVLEQLRPDITVTTAGTFALADRPMSWRTKAAFDEIEIPHPVHRSKQAQWQHLEDASLVIGLSPEHVEWVRREHPRHASRAATLIHIVASLPAGNEPLRDRVAQLGLDGHLLSPSEDVMDPGGHEIEAFVECARNVRDLVNRLAPLI